jgi:hypothetical protein
MINRVTARSRFRQAHVVAALAWSLAACASARTPSDVGAIVPSPPDQSKARFDSAMAGSLRATGSTARIAALRFVIAGANLVFLDGDLVLEDVGPLQPPTTRSLEDLQSEARELLRLLPPGARIVRLTDAFRCPRAEDCVVLLPRIVQVSAVEQQPDSSWRVTVTNTQTFKRPNLSDWSGGSAATILVEACGHFRRA